MATSMSLFFPMAMAAVVGVVLSVVRGFVARTRYRWRARLHLAPHWIHPPQWMKCFLGDNDGLCAALQTSCPTVCWWAGPTELNMLARTLPFADAVVGNPDAFDTAGEVVGSLFPHYLLSRRASEPAWQRLRSELHNAVSGRSQNHSGPKPRLSAAVGEAVKAIAPRVLREFASCQGGTREVELSLRALGLESFVMYSCGKQLAPAQRDELLGAFVQLTSEGLDYRASTWLPWCVPTEANRRIWKSAACVQNFMRVAIQQEMGRRVGGQAPLAEQPEAVTCCPAAAFATAVAEGKLSLDEATDNLAGAGLAAEDARTLLSVVEALAYFPEMQDAINGRLGSCEWSLALPSSELHDVLREQVIPGARASRLAVLSVNLEWALCRCRKFEGSSPSVSGCSQQCRSLHAGLLVIRSSWATSFHQVKTGPSSRLSQCLGAPSSLFTFSCYSFVYSHYCLLRIIQARMFTSI
jgi:hypothetical protein